MTATATGRPVRSRAGGATRPRTAFRVDIQGLRAVAVMSVVLYHLWPDTIRGGFVGVDIFFVISGYLITDQLAREAIGSAHVSLTNFWARRIRRILPAALTVLLACLAFVVLVMPQVTWPNNLSDIRAAASYVENWALGSRAVDYLAAEHSPSIVQHYWSLSVEEQFYLVWPLLVLATTAAARRRRRRPRRVTLTVTLAVVTVASFITSIWWTAHDQPMAFFATPTRAWEFALGGLVALAPGARGRSGTGTGTGTGTGGRIATAWAGIALVVAADAFITRHDAFPGWIAAVPTLGAACVIAARAPQAGTTPTTLLGSRPVQWIGDNSYSIYLWHWPLIIALPWLVHGPLTTLLRFAIIPATFVLAALTKVLVEDPVRRGRLWTRGRWPAYALATAGVAAVLALSTLSTADVTRSTSAQRSQARAATVGMLQPHHHSCFGAAAMLAVNHCARPFARPQHLSESFAASDGPSDPCLQPVDATTASLCPLGDTHSPRLTVAVVGNSHAWRLSPALSLYGRLHHWKILVAARVNCLGLITQPIGSAGATPQCLQWSTELQRELLSTPGLDAVIFAGYRYDDGFLAGAHPTVAQLAAQRRAILATWSTLVQHGIRVIVTGDVPGMRPAVDPECIAQSRVSYDPCSVPRSQVVAPGFTEKLAKANPQLATYIPLTRYFCDATRCHALIGGVIVYFDSHHLTTTYSRSLARYLGADIAASLR